MESLLTPQHNLPLVQAAPTLNLTISPQDPDVEKQMNEVVSGCLFQSKKFVIVYRHDYQITTLIYVEKVLDS